MSDIFLSYSKEDRAQAKIFVAALKGQGWSVFWDHDLGGGVDFSEVIERELEDASCVVVLWSKISVASGWVRDEADAGKVRNILVPVQIDGVVPPMGFRTIHTVDLTKWRGGKANATFRKLIGDIRAKLDAAPERATKRKKPGVQKGKRRYRGGTAGGSGKDTRSGLLKALGLGGESKALQLVAFGVFIALLLMGSFYFGLQQVEQRPQLTWRELKELEEQESRTGEDALWKLAQKQNIAAIYKSYLSSFPDGRYRAVAMQKISALQEAAQKKLEAEEAARQKEKLARARDDNAWNDALGQNSIEGYEAYLRDHSEGRNRQSAVKILAALKADAQRRIDERKKARLNAEAQSIKRDDAAWERARGENTIKSYKAYLVSNGEGRHRGQAREIVVALELAETRRMEEEEKRKQDNLAWEQAKGRDSSESYDAYLTSNPGGDFGQQARDRIAKLQAAQEFARAKKDANVQADKKKDKRERKAWEHAQARNTIGGYNGYLEAHPNGKNSAEAAARRNKLRSAIPNQKILAIYEGIDFFGSDIVEPSRAPRMRNLKACWTACNKAKGCNVFTYNTKIRRCYLKFVKKYEEVVFEEKIATSGFIFKSHDGEPEPIVYPIVSLEKGVEYTGAIVGEKSVEITQKRNRANHCRAACFKENKCLAYTYNSRPNKRECTLIAKIDGRNPGKSARTGGRKLPDRRSVPPAKTFNLGLVRSR